LVLIENKLSLNNIKTGSYSESVFFINSLLEVIVYMKTSVLDIIKQFDLPYQHTNISMFNEDPIEDLKDYLLTLGIDDVYLFLSQLSVNSAIQKIKNFEFKEPTTRIRIIELTNEEINTAGFTIYYKMYPTLFGTVLIASTTIGICYVAFDKIEKPSFPYLQAIFPKALFVKQESIFDSLVLHFLTNPNYKKDIPLHIKGTAFQMNVWKILLKIPLGSLTTYGEIAKKVNNPKGFQAVGTAVGSNPISVLIPCHRVLQSNGKFGGYMWGLPTKYLLIGWEGLQK